jgi:hypothetical protein
MNKSLVLYVFHEYNNRVKYFIDNAIFKHPLVDFIIIYNKPNNITSLTDQKLREIIPEYVKFIIRENIGYDFAGWARGLFELSCIDVNDKNGNDKDNSSERYLYENYKYFIFVNSSVIGPFMPIYCKRKWTDIFIEQLNEQNLNNNVKLLGPTINSRGGIVGIYVSPEYGAHVQSYLFCIERNTLDFLIKEKIFENEKCGNNKELINHYKNMVFEDAIRKEILMSRKIIQNGWNIGSMLKMYMNIDFTFKNKTFEEYKKNDIIFYGDIMYPEAINKLWSQYDVIFLKGNRFIN